MLAEGGCYCGAIRYRISGEPVVKALCFCRQCQHIAGGGPAVIMGVPEAAQTYISGAPSKFQHPEFDEPVTREFCPICGTHMVSRTPRAPGLALIKVGTLDDPSIYAMPQIAVYMGESQPYHAVPEGVSQFQVRPVR